LQAKPTAFFQKFSQEFSWSPPQNIHKAAAWGSAARKIMAASCISFFAKI
jgi:hypothetical protein